MAVDKNRFTKTTRETLAKRAGQTCSNPDCDTRTSGPHSDADRVIDVGEAAHIKGANPGSKRYDESMTPAERRYISNGIWLCRKCAKLIDSDEKRFTVELLYEWKREHEAKIDGEVTGVGLQPEKDREQIIRTKGIGQKGGIYPETKTFEILQQKYIDWLAETNKHIYIPSLNIEIPISEAWVKLRGMVAQDTDNGGNKSLEAELKDYHEWHRLANSRTTETILSDIETVAKKTHNIVVVGGPGSGKSTLLRRLTRTRSLDGKLVLRVSLRAVNLRMKSGETFDEAIIAVASDGYGGLSDELTSLLHSSPYLLADGLDETDPNRADIVKKIRDWASANDTRQVIITTRPIGHNPAWLNSWRHYELLPLKQDDIEKFSGQIFPLLNLQDEDVDKLSDAFLLDLGQSRTASIAARTPQLLGFLIALHVTGRNIIGNRFQLFANIVELIRSQTVPDRRYQHTADKPVAQRVLEHLGWLMVDKTIRYEDELIQIIGKQLSKELSVPQLQSEKITLEALMFWEERGLLERVSTGTESTFTFIHMGLQEFAVTRFIMRLSQPEFVSLVKSRYLDTAFREPLLFLGGTEFLELTMDTLLELDDPSDPVSTAAFLAVDVLAESDNPPTELLHKLFENLHERLNSNIPLVVNEAGLKLLYIAEFNPELVGPIALKLQLENESWIQKVGLALGLSTRDEYVKIEKLKKIFTTETTSIYDGYRPARFASSPLEDIVILEGAKYLLRYDPSEETINAITEKYLEGKYSMGTSESLLEILRGYIDNEKYLTLLKKWMISESMWEDIKRGTENHKKAMAGFLNALIAASEAYDVGEITLRHYYEDSISILYKAFDVRESPVTDIMYFVHPTFQIASEEVIRAAILVTGVAPNSVKNEAKQKLSLFESEDISWYEAFQEVDDEIHFNWDVPNSENTNVSKLIQAMHHPSSFVVCFVSLLLVNSFDASLIKNDLKEVLNVGKNYTLFFVSQIAEEIWQEDAIDFILTRLENNLTEDCAPLIEKLSDLADDNVNERIIAVLYAALDMEDVEIVEAAVECVDKLDLDITFGNKIKERYIWWLLDGPPYPEKGGVVPDNAADTMLTYLIANGRITFDDLLDAIKSRRRDVKEVALSELCNLLAENDERITEIFDSIAHNELPSNILNELATNHPNVCRAHQGLFLQLLDVDNSNVQIACIEALSLMWMEGSKVDEILRSRIDCSEPAVRNEIVKTLRIIRDNSSGL